MMERPTITVADGYNGHTTQIYVDRVITEDKWWVTLQVAEPGKEYMTRPMVRSDFEKIKNGI